MVTVKEKLIKVLIFVLFGIAVGIVIGFFMSYTLPIPINSDSAQIISDNEYYPTATDLIKSADKSIYITMFQMKYYTSKQYSDSETNLLINELISANERGVEVRVLVDESTNDYGDYGNTLINKLRENNVIAKFDRSDVTTHAKFMIIDSKIVLIGSTNWTYAALTKNHETNVLLYSRQTALELEEYFERIWKES